MFGFTRMGLWNGRDSLRLHCGESQMKYKEIGALLYNEIVEPVEGMSADALWGYIYRRVLEKSVPYEERKQILRI